MLRIPSLFYLQIRNVRAKVPVHARPPYPFFHKRDRGWREEGPYFDEAWLWPERSSGWSVVPSWFPNKPEPSFVGKVNEYFLHVFLRAALGFELIWH